MAESPTISTLNDLIHNCRDGEQGFRSAAENVKDPALKSLFNDYARERAAFAEELKTEVARLGGAPGEGGTAAGAMHRGWMDVKGSLTGRDDESILNEAERGEDVAVQSYRTALEEPLPQSVKTMVDRQYAHVKAAHDRVRAERDRRKTYTHR
jgi:uncharacterized protein (TIGR02284 family)